MKPARGKVMWRPPPITRENLRLIVREAPEGTEILVPAGEEYLGPFVFDRPMRLTGQGSHPKETTLWMYRGPAVIVRSTGVSLANLNVELTLSEARKSDATLWYAAGCQPDTQGAQIQGRVEQMGASRSGGGWNLPDLIDLGDIRAKCSVTLPMVIQVPGPARLRGELTNLHVQPARLPVGGEHLIRVGIPGDKLFKDTMLAGQLVVESNGETRSIWIIGRVLEDEFKAWARDRIILVGKSGRKYGFGPGMLLGKEQLRGEPGADRVAEKHAYIMKDPGGVWSLIQPLPVSQPILVNGQPVGVGRRRLLKGSEVIKIGELELTVEAKKTDLPITVDGSVDFGKLSARATATPPVITVRNNRKRNKWQGTLRSTVPWIQVPQPQVVCPGSKAVQVTVRLGTGLSSLPRQAINYTGALVLEGPKETWAISAQLDVDVDENLEVEPTSLDFGRVSDPGAVAPQPLHLRNTGNTDWQGTVQIAAPWLAVDRTSLQCAAGAKTKLEVRLTDQVMALPEGPNAVADALRMEGQGLSVTVAVRLHFDKPKAQPEVQPRSIDWGKVMDWRTAKPQTVQLRNPGTKDWRGKAESKVPWLEVTPTILHCPAQGKATLTVRLTDRFQGLTVGEKKEPAAVRIEGEGKAFSILARLVVEEPPIRPDTTMIGLVLDDRSALPHYALRLQNPGGQDWRGTVKSTLRWLLVSPTDIACPAGGEAVVDVTLSPQVGGIFKKPRTVKVDDAIRIEGRGQPLLVGMRLEIKAPVVVKPSPPVTTPPHPPEKKPKPPVVTPPQPELTVDFDTVSDWSEPLPSREIRLSNSQAQVMKGTVRSTLPWLEVTPESFSCPSGQEVVLTARLTKKAAWLRPKNYNVADALVIESGDKKHLVRARLEVVWATPPKARKEEVPPDTQPPKLAVDFGTVSDWSGPLPTQEIHLSNSQAQVMKGTVRSTVPWLEVTPKSFTCPPGQEVVLTVRLTKAASRLRRKAYDVGDALKIKAGDKERLVKVRVVIGKPIQPTTAPTGEATPPSTELTVDFGTVSDWSGPLPTQEIRLSNSQAQVMEGTVRSTLPWLEVTSESFTCPPGQEVVLTARLTKKATWLRPKSYNVADALVIESGDKKHLVRARLKVAWERPPEGRKKEVPPDTPPIELVVDFGTVSDWSGPLPAREIRLANSQAQVMKGTVRSTLPWLGVAPESFSCPPGQEVVLTARLTKKAAWLQPKNYNVADALVIESGDKKHLVRARLKVAWERPPEARKEEEPPDTQPLELVADFGTVSDWSGPLPTREIRLSNSQALVMKGTVLSTLPWLEVTPASFTCPPGQEVVLTVRLTKAASRLRRKAYDVKDALKIKVGDKEHLVNVRVVAAGMAMRTIVPPREAEPTPPGKKAAASKEKQPEAKKQPAKRARRTKKAPPAKPEEAGKLVVEPACVDFGTVFEWGEPLPSKALVLRNYKQGQWKGRARTTVPWLEISPSEVTCPAGKQIQLEVRLTSNAIHLRSRKYRARDGLVLEGAGEKLEIEACLTVVKSRS